VKATFDLMKSSDISQMPVMNGEEIVGSITENKILSFLL
jgi:cystathionine beta-synthase